MTKILTLALLLGFVVMSITKPTNKTVKLKHGNQETNVPMEPVELVNIDIHEVEESELSGFQACMMFFGISASIAWLILVAYQIRDEKPSLEEMQNNNVIPLFPSTGSDRFPMLSDQAARILKFQYNRRADMMFDPESSSSETEDNV
ncbi:hypothetical protein HDE_08313 [Halotydeus destructor]|nr:hypothetical protein HDE_08313 [Halotydeus destructor]